MKRYEKYKKVNLPCLKEVPEGWDLVELNAIFSERRSKVSDVDYKPLSVTKNGVLPQLENVAKTDNGDNRKKVLKNDFVINSRSDRKGSSGLSDYDGSVSLINIVLKIRSGYKYYWHYLLRSVWFQEEFYRNGKGIVADLWSTKYDTMKKINIPCPMLQEQIQIASFLDWKISEIDRLIELEKRKIEKLEEYFKKIISTKFISSKHIKLKYLLIENLKYGLNESGLEKGDYRYIRITDIDNNGKLKNEDYKYISNIERDFLLRKGDILFARSGATSGKTYLFNENINASFAGYLIRARVNLDKIIPKYLYYYTLTDNYDDWKKSISIQSTIENINSEKYSSLLIPILQLNEQEKIVNLVDDILQKKENVLLNILNQITYLQELKQTLISDVVTGKIDVRGIEIPEKYRKEK